MKVINLEQTCNGCPTIFEWQSKKGDYIYFRLRHGYGCVENETKDLIILEDFFPEADGICDWGEVVSWAGARGLKLNKL